MVKLKGQKTQRITFLILVAVVFFMVTYFANNVHRGSYFQYRNGDFNNTTGGTVNYSYRTGSETQYVHFYEDVYQNGELVSTEWIASMGVGGEVWKTELSLTLRETPDLNWTFNGIGLTSWTTKLADPSYSERTVKYLKAKTLVLTGEDDLVLAAVYQARASDKGDIYPQECKNVLEDLNAVISSNETVVLIRMVTSQKLP